MGYEQSCLVATANITLKAMGFPTDMFTVLFAVARTVGWIAQWKEMIEAPSQKIGRPRQLYTGSPRRNYLTTAQRGWGNRSSELLRYEDGRTVTKADIEAVSDWLDNRGKAEKEIAYRPARVLMQDFTGVPAVVDLAAMRDAMKNLGGDPRKINPLVPVDLVIDHSVSSTSSEPPQSLGGGTSNWSTSATASATSSSSGAKPAFSNFSVVPPGTGICHQVNRIHLPQTVWTRTTVAERECIAYPETPVGTDSHTTMVNGLAVLGWGVGGIEAEAAMLGEPISMLIPEVIGFKFTGKLQRGRHRHRPRAHRDADAAQEGRGGQVRLQFGKLRGAKRVAAILKAALANNAARHLRQRAGQCHQPPG